MDFLNAPDEELIKIAHVDPRAAAALDHRLKEQLHQSSEQSVAHAEVMTGLTRQLVTLTRRLIRLSWILIGLTIVGIVVALRA